MALGKLSSMELGWSYLLHHVEICLKLPGRIYHEYVSLCQRDRTFILSCRVQHLGRISHRFPKNGRGTTLAPSCREPSRPASDTKGERFPSGRSSQLGHVITGRLDKWPCHLFPPAAGMTALTSMAQAWWQFHMTTLIHTEHSVGIQFISLTDLFPIAGRL